VLRTNNENVAEQNQLQMPTVWIVYYGDCDGIK